MKLLLEKMIPLKTVDDPVRQKIRHGFDGIEDLVA